MVHSHSFKILCRLRSYLNGKGGMDGAHREMHRGPIEKKYVQNSACRIYKIIFVLIYIVGFQNSAALAKNGLMPPNVQQNTHCKFQYASRLLTNI